MKVTGSGMARTCNPTIFVTIYLFVWHVNSSLIDWLASFFFSSSRSCEALQISLVVVGPGTVGINRRLKPSLSTKFLSINDFITKLLGKVLRQGPGTSKFDWRHLEHNKIVRPKFFLHFVAVTNILCQTKR